MKTRLIYLSVVLLLFLVACGGGGSDTDPDPCASAITLTVANQQNASSGQSDGSVTVSATGGNGGFQYKLGNGSLQSSATFSGLAAGNYTVTAQDSEGCTATVNFTITEEGSQEVPSFANDVLPIMQARCATSGCHVSGGSAPFVINGYSDVQPRAQTIKTRVAGRTMPPAGATALSNEEISTIVAWVDGGAPDN